MNRKPSIADAIQSLRPSAEWTLTNNSYENLVWLDKHQSKPEEFEIKSELERLETLFDSLKYQRDRSAEYPPITDYLDGVVKGDQAQIDKYIADCQAVKAKYPKGV